MGIFFGPHSTGFAFDAVKQTGFLINRAAGLNNLDMTARLIINRLADKAHRVNVFDLAARAQLSARFANGDVYISAQITFFHITVTGAKRPDNAAKFFNVSRGFLRRTHIGLGNDFHQRDAAAIQIDIGFIRRKIVHGFPGVLLQMEPLNSDGDFVADIAVRINRENVNFAFAHNWEFELRNLISLRQVNIEVVLAVKTREQIDLRV